MHPPNVAVQRLLYGTSIGLLLCVGFGLQAGRGLGASPPAIEAFSALAVFCFVTGWMLGNGTGPLARWFSHETEEAMAARVRAEMDEVQRSEDVTAKWAELEAKVLTQDLGEEEGKSQRRVDGRAPLRFNRGEPMSEVPEGLYYTKEHEWMRVEGDTVTIGITDHAQDMLTDIVYIELPEEGDVVVDMGEVAGVESVKSASPIFAPLAGTITAVNMELEDAPELMNSSPYGDGWIVKMTLDDASAVAGLMDAAAYKAEIGE